MRIIVDIAIVCKATKAMRITMRKEFDADFALVPGMYLVDPTWKKEREITGVTYNPDDPSLYLGITPGLEECQTNKDAEEMAEMYRSAGWRSASEW